MRLVLMDYFLECLSGLIVFRSGEVQPVHSGPVQPRDWQMKGMLLPLGIEKGKEFKRDAATGAFLKTAAAEALAWLVDKAARRLSASCTMGNPVRRAPDLRRDRPGLPGRFKCYWHNGIKHPDNC